MQTLGTLRRRWYVALPLAALSVVMALLVFSGIGPGYVVTASVTVLPPSAAPVETVEGTEVVPVNPLLNFSSSTLVVARVLATAASGPGFRAQVEGDEALSAFTVTANDRDPIIQLVTESRSRAKSLEAAERAIEGIARLLREQQGTDRPESSLSIKVLQPPTVQETSSARLRGLVVTLAVGLLLTVAAAVFVDGQVGASAGRRLRKRSANQPSANPDSTSEDPVTGRQSEVVPVTAAGQPNPPRHANTDTGDGGTPQSTP